MPFIDTSRNRTADIAYFSLADGVGSVTLISQSVASSFSNYKSMGTIINMVEKINPKLQRSGTPLPAGVSVTKEGINFSLFARHATSVTLVVDFLPSGASAAIRHEFPFHPRDNRTGDMWHLFLVTQRRDFRYGYRIDGPSDADGRA
jgi:hypothetical protein